MSAGAKPGQRTLRALERRVKRQRAFKKANRRVAIAGAQRAQTQVVRTQRIVWMRAGQRLELSARGRVLLGGQQHFTELNQCRFMRRFDGERQR